MDSLSASARSFARRAVAAAPLPAKRALHKCGGWLTYQTSAYGPADDADDAADAPAPPTFPTNRPVPLPAGVDADALRATFESWSVDGEPAGHMIPYVDDSFLRFVHTYGLAAGLDGAALELGANPYFTTYLLDDHTSLDLHLANFFGDSTVTSTSQALRFRPPGSRPDDAPVERTYTSDLFNIEEARFPYDDGSFSVVLFCEILEHLLMNPVAVLSEISRTLVDGGHVVLTTPNACRIRNVLTMVHGDSIFDLYSGFGPYGRHNREYTMRELVHLLDFVGFEVEESFTADGQPDPVETSPHYPAVAPLVAHRPDDLGQYLFVRARKVRPPRPGLPTSLYRSWPDEVLVAP